MEQLNSKNAKEDDITGAEIIRSIKIQSYRTNEILHF